jgi:carbamoyl-phosphate synthase large subunit
MVGVTLAEQGFTEEVWPEHCSVKESVFPFVRFAGVDIILGPEMRSTGEVMGIDETFEAAFAKSQIAAGLPLPKSGKVFISMARNHKEAIVAPARKLIKLGFKLLATSGTADVLRAAGVEVETVRKVQEGRPNLLDYMANGDVQFIFNTPSGKGANRRQIRRRQTYGVPRDDAARLRGDGSGAGTSRRLPCPAGAGVAGLGGARAESGKRKAESGDWEALTVVWPRFEEARDAAMGNGE